jgi:hypothetical protein
MDTQRLETLAVPEKSYVPLDLVASLGKLLLIEEPQRTPLRLREYPALQFLGMPF